MAVLTPIHAALLALAVSAAFALAVCGLMRNERAVVSDLAGRAAHPAFAPVVSGAGGVLIVALGGGAGAGVGWIVAGADVK